MTEKEEDELRAAGYEEEYGVWWPPSIRNPAVRHQFMFLGEEGQHYAPGFLGKAEHFRRFITCTMAHDQCSQPYVWNPNAIQMVDDYFANQWTSFVGHGSSGKSRTIAAIAVAEFLMKPSETSCLITSTNIPDGKKRVWADVEKCWFDCCSYFGGEDVMPGELVSSVAIIRYVDRETGYKAQNRGLSLIPSKEDESQAGIGRMKGFKSPRLRLFLDEASDISWKIVEAAETNLITGAMVGADGRKDFKVAATLNANDPEDTGGKLCKPKNGWKSVDVPTSKGWETERGWCRRFSAEDSPNVVLAREGKCAEWDEPFPGLISLGLLNLQKERYGNGSPNFQRQYLAIWPEGGVVETIFTDPEIRHHHCHLKVDHKKELIARIYGFDPCFTHDGDRAPLVWIDLVRDQDNLMIAEYGGAPMWMDEGMDPKKDPNIQIRDKVVSTVTRLGVPPKDFGMDVTGGGKVVGGFIKEKWAGSSGIFEVTFNERASEKPVSAFSSKTGHDLYSNKMTEMWMVAKEMMMSGQVRGLTENVIKELCGRRYDEAKNGRDERGRIKIEETKAYKKRLGKSPDEASAFLLALQLARERYSLLATVRAAKAPPKGQNTDSPYDFSRLDKASKKGFRGLGARFGNLRHTPNNV